MIGNRILRKSALSTLILLLSLSVLALPVFAVSTTLTFEDAPLGALVSDLNYPGVSFTGSNWIVSDNQYVALTGNLLLGYCGVTLGINFAEPQNGVSFKWSSVDYTLQVDAFLGGVPAGTSHFAGPWGSFASVPGTFDALVIGGGTEDGCAAIDDLAYSYGSGATSFTDGRINRYDMGSPVVLYPEANGGLDVYAADGSGLMLRVSAEQIAAVTECPESNATIVEDAATGIILSRLAGDGSCPFQLNAPTAEPGKTYVIIFDSLSSSSDYESFEG